MRKKNKKQTEKIRRHQQRETIKNLHRKLNDTQVQLTRLQGMNDAHLDELNRVAESREREVVAKYQPQIQNLKEQLTEKDTRLRKEFSEAQATKREVQSLQQKVTEKDTELAVIKARDEAHGEELERVRKEAEERTKTEYQKQLEDANMKMEKAQAAEKTFRELMEAAHKLADEPKESVGRGRPKKDNRPLNRPLNLSIPAVMKKRIDFLREAKLITAGELSKVVVDYLTEWLQSKMDEFNAICTKYLEIKE